MSKVSSPIDTCSPSSSQRSGPKLRTPVMPKRSPLETTFSSRYLSPICGPSIFTCSASRKSAAPPTWSIWPWVSQIFSTVTPVCLIASWIFGTSPPGSITTAFLVASHQMMVQFCSNSVTGTMIAPALAWVWVSARCSVRFSWVMSGTLPIFSGAPSKDSALLLLGTTERLAPGGITTFVGWARSEPAQRDEFALPLFSRFGRRAAPELTRGNILVDRGPRCRDSAPADGDVWNDPGSRPEHHEIFQRDAAAEATLRHDDAVAADDAIVTDLAKIIDLGSFADDGVADSAAVDAR